uniref:HAT C-terminal dimerisation domain-containing protein n=1 Tax=Panagrolaimus superbus TaxID=310955 RepID=A0A914ZAX4_9BILA
MHSKTPPEIEQFLKWLLKFLLHFETAIRTLEADKTPTLNLVLPVIKDLENSLIAAAESDDHLKASLGTSALKVLEYKKPTMIHETHAFALILDPLNNRKISQLEDYKTYQRKFEAKVKSISDLANVDDDRNENYNNPFIDAEYLTDKNYEIELKLYYQEKPDAENYDLLDWWRKNQNRFPNLAKLASQVLSIPASSASVERLFSTLNLMTPAERSSICPETLKNLILYRAIDLYEK